MQQEQISLNQKLDLGSTIDSISQVEKFVDDICEEHKIGEELYANILIAITEAANNAIQHGNQKDPGKTFTVSYEPKEDLHRLVFTVRDQGQGFDYENVPDPTAPENLEKPYGRGIFLMRSLADEVNFYDEGRVTELTFDISGR